MFPVLWQLCGMQQSGLVWKHAIIDMSDRAPYFISCAERLRIDRIINY